MTSRGLESVEIGPQGVSRGSGGGGPQTSQSSQTVPLGYPEYPLHVPMPIRVERGRGGVGEVAMTTGYNAWGVVPSDLSGGATCFASLAAICRRPEGPPGGMDTVQPTHRSDPTSPPCRHFRDRTRATPRCMVISTTEAGGEEISRGPVHREIGVRDLPNVARVSFSLLEPLSTVWRPSAVSRRPQCVAMGSIVLWLDSGVPRLYPT